MLIVLDRRSKAVRKIPTFTREKSYFDVPISTPSCHYVKINYLNTLAYGAICSIKAVVSLDLFNARLSRIIDWPSLIVLSDC